MGDAVTPFDLQGWLLKNSVNYDLGDSVQGYLVLVSPLKPLSNSYIFGTLATPNTVVPYPKNCMTVFGLPVFLAPDVTK
jgi:hypothetical protein